MKFKEYLIEKNYDVKKFIESCKKQRDAFKESGNREGEKFLSGVISTYEKEGGISPAQWAAAAKFMGNK